MIKVKRVAKAWLEKNQCTRKCPDCDNRCIEDTGHDIKVRKHLDVLGHKWPGKDR